MYGLLFFWICLGLSIASGQRSFRFVIDDFYVKAGDPDLFESISWILPNESTISLSVMLRRDVQHADLETSLDLYRPNKQILRLYKIRFDACRFLTTIHKNRMFNLFAKTVQQGSMGHLKCPLKAYFNYTVNNMHIEETEFPQYTPECQFKALTKFYLAQKAVMRVFLEGRVEQRKSTT